MAVVSYVPKLITDMQAWFSKYSVTAVVAFGRRARPRHDNQGGAGGSNRVVVMPGDGEGGRAGRIIGARKNVGENPMPIVTWEKLFTVSVWAVDTTDPEDELKQFVAVEQLFELTVAAIRASAHADGSIGDPSWTTLAPHERIYGRELLFPLSLRGPLFGPQSPTATPTLVISKQGHI